MHTVRHTLTAALLAVVVPTADAAQCVPGAQACPIPVQMKPGADKITLVNTLSPKVECCYYSLEARAGQTLTWTFTGPNVRSEIGYPDGSGDGPGIPNTIPLATTGTYVLGFTPDLMAEGIYGPFRLTVTIR
jgi:hypothetical protein